MVGLPVRPESTWMAQQARNLFIAPLDRSSPPDFLIHDRDCKFSGAFDEVFEAEGTKIIRTPIRAPKANAFAGR